MQTNGKVKIVLEQNLKLSIMRSSSKGFTQNESSTNCFDMLSQRFIGK